MKIPNYRAYAISITALTMFLVFTQKLEASPGDSFFNRLQGTWQGDGKTLGMSAHLQMKWEWVLGSKFLRLSLKNEMKSGTGQVQVFEGNAYYQPSSEDKCAGQWFDSRGASFAINGSIDGDALTAQWGATGQEQGKSVYRFLEAGKLEVVDSVRQKDGTWKEFGRFVVIRQ